jgi:hypothetical protein
MNDGERSGQTEEVGGDHPEQVPSGDRTFLFQKGEAE